MTRPHSRLWACSLFVLPVFVVWSCTTETTDVPVPPVPQSLDASIADASTLDGADAVALDAPRAEANDAGACLGAGDGAVADCPGLDEDDAGQPLDGGRGCFGQVVGQGVCGYATGSLKSEVAAVVNACIESLPPTCGEPEVADCLARAITRACPDPSAASFCAGLVQACTDGGVVDAGVAFALCERMATAMNQSGRAAITDCINNAGPCSESLENCVALPTF